MSGRERHRQQGLILDNLAEIEALADRQAIPCIFFQIVIRQRVAFPDQQEKTRHLDGPCQRLKAALALKHQRTLQVQLQPTLAIGILPPLACSEPSGSSTASASLSKLSTGQRSVISRDSRVNANGSTRRPDGDIRAG